MNARTDVATPAVALLDLVSIVPSQTHIQELRRKRFNQDALGELAESLKKVGQLQPIVVRPCPPMMHNGAQFEIVLGERRFLACSMAGLSQIQASVRELNDAEVLEAQLIENLQREDLHPLEEAEGYRELMEAAGIKKEDLGERLGKSRSWVYSRLKLLALQPETRAALETGRIDVSRALVLARVGNKEHQLKMLEVATETNSEEEALYSVRDLARQLSVEGVAISLQLAPFNTTDASLNPERGACTGCEYRSGNNDPENPDPNVCTDRSCYEKKSKAHGARRLVEAEAAGQPILRGESAKAIAGERGQFVGFVDLDLPCDFDEFLEPEPKQVKDEPEESFNARYDAWDARAAAHQPRTYRQLLGAGPWPFQTTLLEGKGKRVIELAPFKDLQKHLKKEAGIQIPAHITAKPEPRQAQPRYDYKAEQAKQEERRKQEQARAEKELAWRVPVFKAIVAAKPAGKLAGDELREILQPYLQDWTVTRGMQLASLKFPDLKKATDDQLLRFARLAIAAQCLSQSTEPADELLALAKACKVDVAKIKREIEAKDKPTEKKGGKK